MIGSTLLCTLGGFCIKSGTEARTQYMGAALLLIGIVVGFVDF